MYSFDKKKWNKHVVKQALYPLVSGVLTLIVIMGTFEHQTLSELVSKASDGFAGLMILILLFLTWITTENWLEDKRRTNFPMFAVTSKYLSLHDGLFEERVKTENVKSFQLEKKGKNKNSLVIELVDGSSLSLEEFLPIDEIAVELRNVGINEL